MGMVTIDKRVIRDGVLIAFKGQVMSEEEAESLGLIAKKQTPPRKEKPKAEKTPKGK